MTRRARSPAAAYLAAEAEVELPEEPDPRDRLHADLDLVWPVVENELGALRLDRRLMATRLAGCADSHRFWL